MDEREFYRLFEYANDLDLDRKLAEREQFYDFSRPHGSHAWETPYEALRGRLS